MGIESTKERFLNAVREDNEKEVLELLRKHKDMFKPDSHINDKKDFTALNIAAAFGSIKVSDILIKNGWKVDVPEQRDLNTSLQLSCKFGYLELMKLFIEYKADITYENRQRMNCLDMAIVYGHYNIAYYLYMKTLKIKTLQEYKDFIQVPSFNMSLYYSTLIHQTLPDEIPSFALRPKTELNKTNTGKRIKYNEGFDEVVQHDNNCSSALFSNKIDAQNCQDLTLSIQTIRIKHKNE